MKFQEEDEVWLNIKNFQLPEGLSHKFLGPYAGPFKVLEKKLSNTYKLELPENLRVHPTFHVSLLKSVSRDASRPNWEHNSRPPPELVHNEPEFEMEAVQITPIIKFILGLGLLGLMVVIKLWYHFMMKTPLLQVRKLWCVYGSSPTTHQTPSSPTTNKFRAQHSHGYSFLVPTLGTSLGICCNSHKYAWRVITTY